MSERPPKPRGRPPVINVPGAPAIAYQQPPQPELPDQDFTVVIKVRNGRFLAALRKAGYPSVWKFCKQHGLPQSVVNRYAQMTLSPIRGSGDFVGQPTAMAQQVADILGTNVEDLFPPRFMAVCLSRIANTELPMTEGQIGMLLREPPRTPEDVLALDEAAAQISDAMILLPPKAERLLRLRLGMNLRDEQTLVEVGEQFGVTRERVRQMENRAIGKLQGPKRKYRFVEAAATLEIGAFKLVVPPFEITAAEAGINEINKPKTPAPLPKTKRPRRLQTAAEQETLRRLIRPVRFPSPTEVRVMGANGNDYIDADGNKVEKRDPDYLRLLRIPEQQRTDEHKLALAYHLEQELIRRGAYGGLQPTAADAPQYYRTDYRGQQLLKYEWMMGHLDRLWQAFPPAPSI